MWRRLGQMADFPMFPHLDHENLPDNVKIVSGGHWKLFAP
jgi:hypothetical protein